MNSLRARLRRDTSTDHVRLDTKLGAYDLTQRGDFTKYLKVHHLARLRLAQHCLSHARLYVPNDLSAALALDLAALDEDLPGWEGVPTREQRHPLGIIYVLAGSSLGGKLLLRRWQAASDQSVRSAGRYIQGAADDMLWREFVAHTQSVRYSEIEILEIVEAAQYCFRIFEAAYDQIEGGGGSQAPHP